MKDEILMQPQHSIARCMHDPAGYPFCIILDQYACDITYIDVLDDHLEVVSGVRSAEKQLAAWRSADQDLRR